MRRREFIKLAGGTTLAWPVVGQAQQTRMRRIAILNTTFAGSDAEFQMRTRIDALIEGLRALNWVEGRNLHIDIRAPTVATEQIKKAADEILALEPDLIVTGSTPVLAILRDKTQSIPIVFAGIADPVGTGVVASLARPGANITGFSAFEYEIVGKWVSLLKELSPHITRVAMLFIPETGTAENFRRSFEAASTLYGVEPVAIGVRNAMQLENALELFSQQPNGGIITLPDGTPTAYREPIMSLSARLRLPAIYPYRFLANAGGLLSYGIVITEAWRRAASYIDRILKGEKPANLPVQAPTRFELAINLKTAKELGLIVPPTMLAIADEVIE